MASICKECAEKAGGKWPEGHLATISMLTCEVCEKEDACADTRDWQLNFNRKTKKAWLMNRKPTMMEVD